MHPSKNRTMSKTTRTFNYGSHIPILSQRAQCQPPTNTPPMLCACISYKLCWLIPDKSLARHRFAQYKLNHTLGLKKTPRNLIRPTAVSRFMNTCGQTCVSKHTPTTILRARIRHIHNNEAAPICPSFTIPQGPVNIYV